MSEREHVFGPSALATPANALTLVRIAASPVLVVLIVELGPTSWVLWALWTALTISDVADGHIARRYGADALGRVLDPLADKFIVLGALGALAGIAFFSLAPVALIAGRELGMSGYRVYASRRGISIPARPSAKLKTLVQDLAIGVVFFPPLGVHFPALARDLLWFAVALTLFTGAQYVFDGRRLIQATPRPGVGANHEISSRAV